MPNTINFKKVASTPMIPPSHSSCIDLCFPCRRHLYLLCPYPSPPCTPCANTLPSSLILSRFGGDYLRRRLHPFSPVLSQHDWVLSKNGTGPTGVTVESSLLSSSAMGTVCVRSSLTWANNCLRFVQRVLAVASLVYSKSCHIWLSTHRDLTRSSIAQFSFPSFAISSSFAFSLFIIPIIDCC